MRWPQDIGEPAILFAVDMVFNKIDKCVTLELFDRFRIIVLVELPV